MSNIAISGAVRIEAASDPRIAAFVQVRERDLVGREGRFIAEGEVVIRHLMTSPLVRPVAMLAAENRLERAAGLLASSAHAPPLYYAGQSVIDAIAGFHLHRGLLALGEAVDPPSVDALLAGLPERALVLGLYGIGNHDNMGGLFRNAAAFGADAVLLAPDCCDPFYRKALRVSVGAALITPFARAAAGEDLVQILASRGFEVAALSPGGAVDLKSLHRTARTAILFGSEGPGLPAELLSRVRTVRISMAAGFDSLNVAAAAGIVLHHLA